MTEGSILFQFSLRSGDPRPHMVRFVVVEPGNIRPTITPDFQFKCLNAQLGHTAVFPLVMYQQGGHVDLVNQASVLSSTEGSGIEGGCSSSAKPEPTGRLHRCFCWVLAALQQSSRWLRITATA